jgi:hypothetical protein
MNTMYRCALAVFWVAAATFVTPPVAAQVVPAAQAVRNFPPNTLRGVMMFGEPPLVTVDGRETQLTPGTRMRDAQNQTVLSGAVSGTKQLVHYTLDLGGLQVRDVWFLSPEEAAIKPWPRTLEQARTWTFDGNRWVLP